MTDPLPIHPPPVVEHDARQGVAILSPAEIEAMMQAAPPTPEELAAMKAEVMPPNGRKDDPDQKPLYVQSVDVEKGEVTLTDQPPADMDPLTGEIPAPAPATMAPEVVGADAGGGMGAAPTPPPSVPTQPVKTGGGKKRGDAFGPLLRAAILSDVIGPRIADLLDEGTIASKAELHRRFAEAYESPVSLAEFGNWLDECGISFQTTLKVSLPEHLRRFAQDVSGSLAPVQDGPGRRIPSPGPIEAPPAVGVGESDQPCHDRPFNLTPPTDEVFPGMQDCVLSSVPMTPPRA